jgi:hypothetical protein
VYASVGRQEQQLIGGALRGHAPPGS